MKLTSAGSNVTGGGSSECPFCHVPFVKIHSKTAKTFGEWFLKCPYNIYGDPNTCGYIRPEVPNMKLEAQEHQLKAKKEASGDCCSELKAD